MRDDFALDLASHMAQKWNSLWDILVRDDFDLCAICFTQTAELQDDYKTSSAFTLPSAGGKHLFKKEAILLALPPLLSTNMSNKKTD